MNFDKMMEKTLSKERGYKYGNYRTEYDKPTETFKLFHFGTLTVKARRIGTKSEDVRCTKFCEAQKTKQFDYELCKKCCAPNKPFFEEERIKGAWELLEWGGWSYSDRDSINRTLGWLGIKNVTVTGIGLHNTGELQVWIDGIPVDKVLQPLVDLDELKNRIRRLKLLGFDVKLSLVGDIVTRNDRKTVAINPYMNIEYLDYYLGLQPEIIDFNGQTKEKMMAEILRNVKQKPKAVTVIYYDWSKSFWGTPEHATRLLLLDSQGNVSIFALSRKYHNTVKKALNFITKNADYRQGDLCFKKTQRIPKSLKETRRARWSEEESETIEIFEKEDQNGHMEKYARITHKIEIEHGDILNSQLGDYSWQPNLNPHEFTGDYQILRVRDRQYLNARSQVVVSHKEHGKLTLPVGYYQFYAVRGLERRSYGID